MDMFKGKTMNLDGGYVIHQLSVKTMLKQAAFKARISLRSIINFLAEEEESFKDTTIVRSSVNNKRTTILSKFSQSKVRSNFNSLAKNRAGSRANVIDFKSENTFTLSENSINMSPAQIVFAVIHKQQVEWMKETEKGF